MATKAELCERWKTPAGRRAGDSVRDALRDGAPLSQLESALRDLPFTSEVAPYFDFRCIEIPTLIAVRERDLSGARFDGANINWSFSGSALRQAVFDRAEGRNVDFGGCDLTGSSFVKAKLPGAIFYGARLIDADLSGIQMRGGQLKDADCTRAKIPEGDLRLVWAAHANLSGADLNGVNLIGASLGGAKWDQNTRLQRAKLSPEGTPAELLAFAISQGAGLVSENRDWQLSLLDATARALENEYGKSAVAIVRRMRELRADVERDPSFSWARILHDELDNTHWQTVQEAVRKAASNIGALLG